MSKFSQRVALFAAMVAVFAVASSSAMARGGGHGGGGFRGGYRGGYANHPFHPSQYHYDHHYGNRDHQANYDHHHHTWYNGGWGPGFWGGAAVGYGLGYGGWGYEGGNTYIDNTTNVSTDTEDSDESQADEPVEVTDWPITSGNRVAVTKAPFDDWPELGVVTYAGQYGGTLGQVVVRVVPNSAAARAGFVAGDVILSLNGQPTPSADSLEAILENANVQFSAEVWDARTGRKSTLSGSLDPLGPKGGKTAAAQR